MAEQLALGIDIGGTGIKAALVDTVMGRLATERRRVLTPHPALPAAVATALGKLLDTPEFQVSAPTGAGFPGVIKEGRAFTAANLGKEWIGADIASVLGEAAGRTVTVLNDADAAGLAEARFGAGRGVMGVVAIVTLGTGIGTALFHDGQLIPNTELGHIELRGKDAERRAAASVRERKQLSWKTWAASVEEYLNALDRLTWPDLIIIGGGVSATPQKFLPHIRVRPEVVPAMLGNDAGIIGAALWAIDTCRSAGG